MDPNEDSEDIGLEAKEEMEYEASESKGEATPIEEEEPVASPPPTSYYLGSGIPRNRKHAQKTIPTCGGIKKKKPRMRVHRFPSLTGNFHPYHAAPVEPAPNPVSEAPRAIQEMRMHDPDWITDVVNEWVRDQGGTHRFEVGQCSKSKPPTTTEEDRLSYLFDRTLRLGHRVEAIGGEVHTLGANDDLRARQIEELRAQRRRDQEDMKKDRNRTQFIYDFMIT